MTISPFTRREARVYKDRRTAFASWEEFLNSSEVVASSKSQLMLLTKDKTRVEFRSVQNPNSFRGHEYDAVHFVDCYDPGIAVSDKRLRK